MSAVVVPVIAKRIKIAKVNQKRIVRWVLIFSPDAAKIPCGEPILKLFFELFGIFFVVKS